MTNPADRVEIITSVQRRRCWTASEKVRIVEETFDWLYRYADAGERLVVGGRLFALKERRRTKWRKTLRPSESAGRRHFCVAFVFSGHNATIRAKKRITMRAILYLEHSRTTARLERDGS